jgi:deazaflavin-dependent oxidoreductase (nitroreductase family)
MPIPQTLATFNKHVTNRITGPFAGVLPGFAVVSHVGRKSGRTYRTPVNMFRRGADYVFVMTYGPDVDWVKNVDAAGGAEILTKGQTVRLTDPRHFTDRERRCVPAAVRPILRLLGVDEFLAMRDVSP